VVTAAKTPQEASIGPVIWGSAPEKGDTVRIEGWRPYIQQEGQAVFRWATTKLHPVAQAACAKAGVDPRELAAFVPHQANLRIMEALARQLQVPRERVADDIVHAGNTSSASIPLALSRMIERDELGSGEHVLLLGFGAGLSYAAQVITMP
jgi:3-oxoacyl-[acyl-carrier-protein] synthase-3